MKKILLAALTALSLIGPLPTQAAGSGIVDKMFVQPATGATAQTVVAKLAERVSVFDFMTPAQVADVKAGTALVDVTAALQAARDAIAANHKKLIFPAGRYRYSVSPNWAIQDAEIVSEGEVFLRYTGTGNAVTIDAGGANNQNVYNLKMGAFIVEAPSTALDGVYVRGIHHSDLAFNVRGAGVSSAGVRVKFAVATVFRLTVSVNEAGWYASAPPSIGINLEVRNAGETVSYSTFINPVVEGPAIGIQLNGTLGNSFIGGTAEGCANYGVFASAAANNDKFWGTDFEANTGADVYSLGTGITFTDTESTNLIAFGATSKRNTINGGEHSSILFDAGSIGNIGTSLKYNRLNNGGTFTDAGTNSAVIAVKNAQTGLAKLANTAAFSAVTGLPSGSTTTTTIAVAGAKTTDVVLATLTPMTAGFTVSASVLSADVVTVMFTNQTGSTATLAAGTLKAVIVRN